MALITAKLAISLQSDKLLSETIGYIIPPISVPAEVPSPTITLTVSKF